MAFEEIERLKEKVEKDQSSKLFVPLAEEYKKAGMLTEAIEVLTKGLEMNPSYMSARVSLGKIYLEKEMLREASEEFEKVVKAIPDNLYAQKKLAEIYRDLGERDKALEAFRRVLELNPADEEVAKSLADLEGKFTVHPEVTKIVKAMLKEEKPSEIPVGKEIVKAEEEIEEVLAAPEVKLPEEILAPQDIFKEPDTMAEEVFEKLPLSISDADPHIAQGRYEEAMDIYKSLLLIEPDNERVLQRTEELKALLKLLGKENKELIARLNRFLDGIKKRRDEFL